MSLSAMEFDRPEMTQIQSLILFWNTVEIPSARTKIHIYTASAKTLCLPEYVLYSTFLADTYCLPVTLIFVKSIAKTSRAGGGGGGGGLWKRRVRISEPV